MTPWTAIRRAIASGEESDKAIAADVLAKLPKRAFIDLVSREVAHIRRDLSRGAEQRAFREMFALADRAETELLVQPLQPIFENDFALGDSFQAMWGSATVAEHRRRIALLTKIRIGLDDTIRRHEEAIALIERAGAQCLDDIAVTA